MTTLKTRETVTTKDEGCLGRQICSLPELFPANAGPQLLIEQRSQISVRTCLL